MIDVFEPIRPEMDPSKPPRNDNKHVIDLLHRNETVNSRQTQHTQHSNPMDLLPELTINARADPLPPSRHHRRCLLM